MKKYDNCVHLKVEHILFENNSPVFEFVKSKGYQGGEEHVVPWKVYSSPLDPSNYLSFNLIATS